MFSALYFRTSINTTIIRPAILYFYNIGVMDVFILSNTRLLESRSTTIYSVSCFALRKIGK